MRGCSRNWLTKSKAPQRETAIAIAVQVAHAVGVFRMRSRPEARRQLPASGIMTSTQRVEPIAQFSNHRSRPRQMTGETGKMAEIGCEWALFCRNGRSV